MGVLGDQSKRNYWDVGKEELNYYLEEIKSIAKSKNLEVGTVIKATEVLELRRRNNLYAQNGDYFDEQMGGFGDIFRSIAEALDK